MVPPFTLHFAGEELRGEFHLRAFSLRKFRAKIFCLAKRDTADPCSGRDRYGFSPMELLVVVGVFVVLMTIATPSFGNFGQAQGVTEASYQVAAAIERARSEALARSGYVRLAIEDEGEAGTRQPRLGIALVKDSNPTNLSENLQPLVKPMTIQRVGLANSQTPGIAGGEGLSSHTGGATFPVGKARFQKVCSLLLAPTGEVCPTAPSSQDDFRFDPLKLSASKQPEVPTTSIPKTTATSEWMADQASAKSTAQ